MAFLIWLTELWAPAIARGGADRTVAMASLSCPCEYSYWASLEDVDAPENQVQASAWPGLTFM
jgi:hypothetical protein